MLNLDSSLITPPYEEAYDVWRARRLLVLQPLQAVWIPAHLLEQIPEELIDSDMARAHGSCVQDIIHIRTLTMQLNELHSPTQLSTTTFIRKFVRRSSNDKSG